MIDYIKMLLKNVDVENLKSRLDFISEYISNTGESTEKYTYKFYNCTLTITANKNVLFAGSLHKLHNGINNNYPYKEGFNGNSFTYQDFKEIRQYLSELTGVCPSKMVIQVLELGINVPTPFDPKQFVKGMLFHKGKGFEFRHNKNYAECKHDHYNIKVYNKGYQFKLNENILRFEVKFKKSIPINQLGIITLSDINQGTLKKGFQYILNTLDELVYYDYTIRTSELRKSIQNKIYHFKNDIYWLDDLNKKQRYRQKQILNKIISENSKNLRNQITKELIRKWGLINQNIKEAKKEKGEPINPFSIGLNRPHFAEPKTKSCLITGVDISHQKKDSFLLSHTGLRILQKESPDMYLIIKNKYLSKKWVDANDETQIREIAHNIRNKCSNSRISLRKRYNPKQTTMFTNIFT
jgi:hypothetical protein